MIDLPKVFAARRSLAAGILGCLLLTGCYSSGVMPKESEVALPAAKFPVPATITLIATNDGDASRREYELIPGLKCDLDAAGIFSAVHYPARFEDRADATLKVALSHHQDGDRVQMGGPGAGVEVFIIPFALTIAIVKPYDEQWFARCEATLEKNGTVLKRYQATGVAKVHHGAFAGEDWEQEAYAVASKQMGADLARQLIEDREFLVKALAPGNAPSATKP